MDNNIQSVESDGFAILQERCEPGLMDQLLDICKTRSDRILKALGTQDIGIGSAAGYDEIVQRSPGRWDIPISPTEFQVNDREMPWWPLVTGILGDDVEHSFSGLVFSDPDTPAQCWHIDSPHVSDRHLPAHAMNVMVALHDVTMDMGPTEVARGSHVLTNHLANPSLIHDELVYQHAETSPAMLVDGRQELEPECIADELGTGTCLAFDDRIMHRGLANRSPKTRYMAYFSYRKAGYSENTHFEAVKSVFRSHPG